MCEAEIARPKFRFLVFRSAACGSPCRLNEMADEIALLGPLPPKVRKEDAEQRLSSASAFTECCAMTRTSAQSIAKSDNAEVAMWHSQSEWIVGWTRECGTANPGAGWSASDDVLEPGKGGGPFLSLLSAAVARMP